MCGICRDYRPETHLSKEVLLQAPIDLDQVDYIQFGNQQIQVN